MNRARSGLAFRDVPPAPRHARWVASLWSLVTERSSPAKHYWVAPDGCSHLVVRHDGVLLAGPQTAPRRRSVEPGTSSFGIRLQPGAVRALCTLRDLPSLQGRWIDVAAIPQLRSVADWGIALDRTRPLEEQAASACTMLDGLVEAAGLPDAIVTDAVHHIQSVPVAPTVESLARRAGLSSRQFRRRFHRAVDLSPNAFTRIWRFRRCVLDLLDGRETPWATRAAEHGFADQSHLIREFGRLGGMTPREFVQRLRNVAHDGTWDPTRSEYRRR